MKRFIAILAAAILCLACAACGCTNSQPATTPTTTGTTPATMPTITLPTMETNIPDPEVNDNSTIGTDMVEIPNATSSTEYGRNRSIMK